MSYARRNPGVPAAVSSNPQCSHENHTRDWSHFQFHVSVPHFGHGSGCDGFGASHSAIALPNARAG